MTLNVHTNEQGACVGLIRVWVGVLGSVGGWVGGVNMSECRWMGGVDMSVGGWVGLIWV